MPADPHDEQIADALVTLFQGITNSYETDVQAVYRYDKVPSELPVSNAVAFRLDRSTRDPDVLVPYQQKTMTVHVALYSKGWENHEARLSAFEADVEKAMYADVQLGGLAQTLTVGFSERFLPPTGKQDVAIAVLEIAVQYRHEIADPYTLYAS